MITKNRKLESIKKHFFTQHNLTFHDKWFKNLTDIDIPLEVKWLLSLGNKFALPINLDKLPLFKLIADVEDCLRRIADEKERDTVRARITHILSTVKHNNNVAQNPLDRVILNIHNDCIAFLKQHNDIIIVQADKGGATVAMYKKDYHAKMLAILNDTSNFIPSNNNPRKTLENSSNRLIKQLFECKAIDEMTRRKMTKHNTHIPRIYALPKVHKPNTPHRHIVSTIDSAASELSIFVDKIVKRWLHDKYDVKNSFEVKNLTSIDYEA